MFGHVESERYPSTPRYFHKNGKLRFLKFYSLIDDGEYESKLSNFQGLILSQARYFHWHGYPSKSLLFKYIFVEACFT